MKTFIQLIICTLALVVTVACHSDSDILEIDKLSNQNQIEFSAKTDHNVTVPFKANFYTLRDYSNSGVGYCTVDPYLGFNYQVGAGEATHLGKFQAVISFCGAGFAYNNGQGVLTAANGDELYIAIDDGLVKLLAPGSHPLYEAEFQDPFTFVGGTGRFEGASGGGFTNSFVDLFDDEGNYIAEHRTDHVWVGDLILPRNNN